MKIRIENKILIFVLLSSILVLSGCSNSNTIVVNNTSNVTTSSTSKNVGKSSSNSKFILGNYSIDPTDEIIENGFGDEYISFLEDGKFEAYLGWGSMLFGTYTISENNVIVCKGKSHSSEYTNLQDVNVVIEFKIQDVLTIKIINSSDNYTIETSVLNEDSEWVPSGETKEMSLYPYEVGTTFTLNNE